MRALLDENLPRQLKGCFSPAVEVVTVPERGWAGMKNGELLRVAAVEFDLFVSMDVGIPYQQNMRDAPLCVMLLSAPSNRYHDLFGLMPRVNEELTRIQSGAVLIISLDRSEELPRWSSPAAPANRGKLSAARKWEAEINARVARLHGV